MGMQARDMESKAKTLQERFGFSDPDLKTPKHDAIMLWLDGEMENILAERCHGSVWKFIASVDGSWFGRSDREVFGEADALMEQLGPQAMRDLAISGSPSLSVKKTWECPILNKNYTIGFADMRVRWSAQVVDMRFVYSSPLRHLESRISEREEHPVYFEVKPSIPSAGELLRQIRMYQTYTEYAKWFVVSPDDRFRSIIEEQGVGFIKAPSEIHL